MAKFKVENFKVLSKDDTAVIYRTPDKSYNKLTFSITNISLVSMELKGGAQPSVFSFNMRAILSNEVVKHLSVKTPAGWEATPVEVQSWVEWKLTCRNDMELAPSASISFTIENILCEKDDPGYFQVTNKDIPGYTDNERFPVSVFLSILRPPVDPAKINPVPLIAGYTNVVHPIANQTIRPNDSRRLTEHEAIPVYLTYDVDALIKNGFKLLLTNYKDTAIDLKAVSSDSEKPVVTISFLFGEKEHDITTQALADRQITIGSTKSDWTPMKHGDGSPSWRFYPDVPQKIKAKETIGFNIENIVTPVDIESIQDGKISLMYIQINKFGDFDDKVFIFQLLKKKATADINYLLVDHTNIKIGENVKLSWRSSLAKRVTITYHDRDNKEIQLDTAATGANRIELDADNFLLPVAPTAENTWLTAVGYDTVKSDRNKKDAEVKVEQRAANIKWFRVTPQFIAKGAKTKVTFSWEVEDAIQLILVAKDTEIDVTGLAGKEIEVEDAFQYTLRAYAYGTRLKEPYKKELRTFAYKNETAVSLPLIADQKQNRPAIILNSNTRFKRVYISNKANNTIYEISTDDGSIVRTYTGSIFALLPDGTKLAVFNNKATPPNIMLYDVATGNGYSRQTVALLRIAEQMRFSPDGKKLFFTYTGFGAEPSGGIVTGDYDYIDPELGTPITWTTFFTVDAERNTLKGNNPMTSIGSGAGSIAFNKDLSMVYFPAYDSPNVFLVKNDGRRPDRDISVPYTKGILIKENRESNRLYAAFENNDSIIVIDTVGNYGCATIAVGEYPSDMVLSQDGTKLYIACLKANKVTVVDTATNNVIKTYEAINTPAALTLSQNEDVLLVANYCAKSVSMIDLKIGDVISGTITTGTTSGNPFGISALDTAKGSKVLVAKESYPERVVCTDTTKNMNLDVTVITIEKPEPKKQ